MANTGVAEAVARLASRDKNRTEADVQADIYVVLTSGQLDLDSNEVVRLEAQVGDGTRRRLDIEIGHCVIEVKKDLRVMGIRKDAEQQLAGYVRSQSRRLRTRYVGILTDGTEWLLYHLHSDALAPVATLTLPEKDPDSSQLLVWLESVLSTQDQISPVPIEIERRLGVKSPAYLLDHATLADLYAESVEIPEVALKRSLWAKLLRTAFGTAFNDDENLFIDHTLLVLTAEIIAHAVVGYDISPLGQLRPEAIARGSEFASSQINGVVEADFFDWVIEVPGGPEFVTELARRIARFDWTHVEHDVLKILYESVISSEARASLGEYYTPDWLADRIVDDAISDPLNTTALDPSCGSGTFLFHAVRAYLVAAEREGISSGEAARGVTRHIFGMDVHPVAVTLARVTYLLAIGKDRLTAEDRGEITIPVYLGDSLQWEQRKDLIGGVDNIAVTTAGDDLVEGGGGVLFGDDLIFPRTVLDDAERFDQLVRAMADKALDVSGTYSRNLIDPILRRFKISGDDAEVLTNTFHTMRQLHKSGRNHIWGYYVRNLIRPLWMAEEANRVDVLIGNPPWLRYSKMTAGMQNRYKKIAKERQLLTGGLGASARDLSTLFVVRAIELYLREGGKFAFVMPHGTLTRKPHTGFRAGKWSAKASGKLNVRFDIPWDLSEVTTGFPMVSCVVRGASSTAAVPIKPQVIKWIGRLSRPDLPWSTASSRIVCSEAKLAVLSAGDLTTASPYKARFRQGAILVPRMLLFVEKAEATPLGAGAGRTRVVSRRTSLDKWKADSISGVVETKFLRPSYLGEHILPFRPLEPLQAVLPLSDHGILRLSEIELHPGLENWWKQVEATWKENRVKSEELPLLKRFDHHSQLSAQLPVAAHRVVYTKTGNSIAAARLDDRNSIIDHSLYWASVNSVNEGRYLTAILNSQVVLDRVKPLQALGLFGGRHIDKNVFAAPIPTFNPTNDLHVLIATLTSRAEEIAASVPLASGWTFQRKRTEIRESLERNGVSGEIETAVGRLIPPLEN